MAIEVDPNLSPRIATVPIGDGVQISMQDLGDELKEWAQEPQNLTYANPISSSGKQDLGSGVLVGITNQLENTRLAFEQRTTSVANGTVTTTDTRGINLIDSTANFVTLNPGAWVINITDRSVSTIYRIANSTSVFCYALSDGIDNTWTSGDVYKIWQPAECEASGGNLVAVNAAGDNINAFMPTWGTHVVRTSSSSATLQEQTSIQQASFDNRILVDAINGTASTVFPAGTGELPVINIDTAKIIATERGLNTIEFIGNYTFTNTDSLTSYILIGQSTTLSSINIPQNATIINCEFKNATIDGWLDGGSTIDNCVIGNLYFVDGSISHSGLSANVVLSGAMSAQIIDCHSNIPGGETTPWIDMNAAGSSLLVRDYHGGLGIKNRSGQDAISIDMSSGQVILDNTITAGEMTIRGVCKVVDNTTGTANVYNETLSPTTITNATWSANMDDYTTDGTFGSRIKKLLTKIQSLYFR